MDSLLQRFAKEFVEVDDHLDLSIKAVNIPINIVSPQNTKYVKETAICPEIKNKIEDNEDFVSQSLNSIYSELMRFCPILCSCGNFKPTLAAIFKSFMSNDLEDFL